VNESQIREAQRLIAIARDRLAEARADRPGVAGYGERVRAAQAPLDALERRLMSLEAHQAQGEARAARQSASVATAAPPPPITPAVAPDVLDRARHDLEAAQTAAARTRTDRPAWPCWPDRWQAAQERLRNAQLRLAALERQDAAHQRSIIH
jgi:hypothetical protein